MKIKLIKTNHYLLLVDESIEIIEGTYYLTHLGNIYKETARSFKEDEGLERFSNRNSYKPIIAYKKLNEEAKELDLPELPNPFEEINVERLAQSYLDSRFDLSYERTTWQRLHEETFTAGYKAAQSKQFSLEDMKKAIGMARSGSKGLISFKDFVKPDYTEEQIIQSLSTQQLPKEFIPETEVDPTNPKNWYEDSPSGKYWEDEPVSSSPNNLYTNGTRRLKTITNPGGKQELIGKFVW